MAVKSHLFRFRRRHLISLLVLLSVVFGSVTIFGGDSDYLESLKTLIIQPDDSNQEPTAAIINKHIANLNKNSSAHINQEKKEEYIQYAMILNYLIVFSISILITFKTRSAKETEKKQL